MVGGNKEDDDDEEDEKVRGLLFKWVLERERYDIGMNFEYWR